MVKARLKFFPLIQNTIERNQIAIFTKCPCEWEWDVFGRFEHSAEFNWPGNKRALDANTIERNGISSQPII